MDQDQLWDFIYRRAKFISDLAENNRRIISLGVELGIKVPNEADEEAMKFVDGELRKLHWSFLRFQMPGSGRWRYLFSF